MGKLLRYVAPLVLVPLAACLSPPVATPRTTVTQESSGNFGQDIKNKVDVLFMIDNSLSMDPMQIELRQRFGDFFQVFQDLATQGTFADLHIGVVTSDYGAGDSAGNGCDASPGGQRGLLQTAPSSKATNPPTGCLPPTGKPYIAYAFGAGAPTTNLPNGNDPSALVDEFTCMASVGAAGCGFEHQLESVYAALRNTKENSDFLRNDALLAVVFVTNEDDGSAPTTAKFYENNGDMTGTSALGQFTTYRQTRFAVDCGGMPIPYGMADATLTGCDAAPNPTEDPSLAYDVQRYIDFFTRPAAQGGVKVDPKDVILVGIMGPPTPFKTRLIDPAQGNAPYHDCPAPLMSASCVEALDHSCGNNVQPGFFADPAVRLTAVVDKAAHKQISSICGDDLAQAPDYSGAMGAVGQLIKTVLQPGCINAPVASRRDGTPDCVVEDVTTNLDGSTHITPIASCVENGDVPPCWQIVDLRAQYQMQGCVAPPAMEPPSCTLPPTCQPVTNPLDGTQQLASIAINRGGVPAADNTAAHVDCATIASSQ